MTIERDVAELVHKLRTAFPLAAIEVDPPLQPGGSHHVDVRWGDRLLVIEWSGQRGYGVSLIDEAALDGGPDFRVANADRAFAIVKLLLLELQDALLTRELGDWAASAAEPIDYRDLAVGEGDRRAPRQRAA